MSEILYSNYNFPSGYSCQVCISCCFKKVIKNRYDAVPLEIDWMKEYPESGLRYSDNIKDVEFIIENTCGEEVDDCEAGVTYLGTSGSRPVDRKTVRGPVTSARLYGGGKGSYRIAVHVIYERCGHCYDLTTCIDLEIKDHC